MLTDKSKQRHIYHVDHFSAEIDDFAIQLENDSLKSLTVYKHTVAETVTTFDWMWYQRDIKFSVR